MSRALAFALPFVGSILFGLLGADCTSEEPPSASRGAELYGKYCALCHGGAGEGYRADDATALANAKFLSLASDPFLESSIANGRPGTTMSAWHTDRGGPLDTSGIRSIVLHLRSLTPHTLEDSSAIVVNGDLVAGGATYTATCQECHGRDGEGGKYVNLGNPEFLASASDGFLLRSIEDGRPGTPMPAYRDTLSATARADLVKRIRAWQRPTESPLPQPPRPGNLRNVVLFPNGPNADFREPRFVPVDTVKAAMDAGKRMVLLDARPPSDYSRSHVTGAISSPFYETGDYAPEIPKDAPVVAYCGCPHAESGVAADKLLGLGYPKVYVLDEGFGVWRERGYPVRGGPTP